MNLSKQNYIYKGRIQHHRFTPVDHYFSYSTYMTYLDLQTIESAFSRSWFWNVNRFALVSFFRKDYHGDVKKSLDSEVRNTIKLKTGKEPRGRIRLLTNLRYFGYCFNPVSFYYCFDESDKHVETIMAEVTNTPWNERHCYIINKHLTSNQFSNLKAELKKKLHVSPFWGMDHNYQWIFNQPKEKLFVNMINFKDKNKVFRATLDLKRYPMTLPSLAKLVVQYPFLTFMVIFKIHFQALKLWLKKVPFFIHPNKIKAT